jgi:type II secretory pathway pseudopilin PulG
MIEQKPNGFVLIELVTTIILVGFIGAFVGLFLYTGINGYLAAKRNTETALKAQFALDRLSAELRHINELVAGSPPVENTSITYRTRDLTGSRRIRYAGGDQVIYFSADGGTTEFPLLDRVTEFTLGLTHANMDQLDDDDEIRSIAIGFTLAEVPRSFQVRIFPRTLIKSP